MDKYHYYIDCGMKMKGDENCDFETKKRMGISDYHFFVCVSLWKLHLIKKMDYFIFLYMYML